MAMGTGRPGPVHVMEALAIPVPSGFPKIRTLQRVLKRLEVLTSGRTLPLFLQRHRWPFYHSNHASQVTQNPLLDMRMHYSTVA